MPTDDHTIHVRIHELRQLFNSIDPSPFRERDLDPDCEELIVSWAREMPPDRSLRVQIRVHREQPPAELVADVTSAVQDTSSAKRACKTCGAAASCASGLRRQTCGCRRDPPQCADRAAFI